MDGKHSYPHIHNVLVSPSPLEPPTPSLPADYCLFPSKFCLDDGVHFDSITSLLAKRARCGVGLHALKWC